MISDGNGGWRLLHRSDLDVEKWDKAIQQSETPLLYATSPWLDAMTSRKWQACVFGDYNQAFPLYSKKKFGIPYITQPFLCQRLGFFGKETNSKAMTSLLGQLKEHYWKIDIMSHLALSTDYHSRPRRNHILPIADPYDLVAAKYHRNTRRNIEKAHKESILVQQEENHTTILPFLISHDTTSLLSRWQENVTQAMEAFQTTGGSSWTARKDGEVLAAAYCVCYADRVYFLLCQSSQVGKQTSAMYLLIDALIRHFAGVRSQWFDFTGSGIPSIARRNISFGAIEEVYWHYQWRFWHRFIQ